MSEEEKKIIDTVENFIKYYKENEQAGNRANLDVLREECNAIEFILNKYDIQQKELEQEKEKNKKLKNKIADIVLLDDNTGLDDLKKLKKQLPVKLDGTLDYFKKVEETIERLVE